MLELLYCILVGTGALTILCAIFYGLAMLFHKGQAAEEEKEETNLDPNFITQMLCDFQNILQDVAAVTFNSQKCLLALAFKHGDLDFLNHGNMKTTLDETVHGYSLELEMLRKKLVQQVEGPTDEESAT